MAEKSVLTTGPERMSRDAIPAAVTEAVAAKLAPGGTLHPAREGGSYKGKVLHVDQDYVVQAVGTTGKSAVVHQRTDLKMVDQNVQWRSENERLGSTPIQVHYKGDDPQAGKVYRWDRAREQAARAMWKAETFAKGIADPKERDAFLKNTQAMLQKATKGTAEKAPPAAERKAPDKAAEPKPTAAKTAKDAGDKPAPRRTRSSPDKASQKTASGPER